MCDMLNIGARTRTNQAHEDLETNLMCVCVCVHVSVYVCTRLFAVKTQSSEYRTIRLVCVWLWGGANTETE